METLSAFVHEHRSNEANFEKLVTKLNEANALPNREAINEKAEEYRKAKEVGGSAWPEFEKFITEIEKTLMRDS